MGKPFTDLLWLYLVKIIPHVISDLLRRCPLTDVSVGLGESKLIAKLSARMAPNSRVYRNVCGIFSREFRAFS
jgi:hypothetical protein